MRLHIAFAVTVALSGTTALGDRLNAQAGPPSPRRLTEIHLRHIPTTVRYRGRAVTVRFPASAERRVLGGSGGLIVEVVVAPPGGGTPVVFETQVIGLAVVEAGSAWPAIEGWSNAGGGTYTRVVSTWHPRERAYCADRVDEFDDTGDETASPAVVRIAGSDRLVRFGRSRPFGCER